MAQTDAARARVLDAIGSDDGLMTERAREENVRILRRTYRDRFRQPAVGEAAHEAMNAMRQLMTEWNPVGYLESSLLQILGEPSSRGPEILEYRFDTGRTATAWRFRVGGNTVWGVEWVPGE